MVFSFGSIFVFISIALLILKHGVGNSSTVTHGTDVWFNDLSGHLKQWTGNAGIINLDFNLGGKSQHLYNDACVQVCVWVDVTVRIIFFSYI